MKVWQAHALGEPGDVLRLADIDAPQPGVAQAVVRVEAVGLNFPDVLRCRGGYQVTQELPFAVGNEICGTVVELGAGVTSAAVGDRVAAAVEGGLAEKVAVDAGQLLPVPPSVAPITAAAILGNYTTMWFALHDRARLQPGESVLVHAGAGGIGSAAIQLALAAGATVIATAGGSTKVGICHELGVEHAIDYLTEDIVERVRDLTDGRGVDVVCDPVGGDVFDVSRRAVGWNGRYLVIGFAGGRIPQAPLNHVLLKNYSLVGVHWGAAIARDDSVMPRVFATLMEMCEERRIDPLLFGEPLPMAAAADGLTLLAARRTWGKVIVDPQS